ncbi:DNA cytosine methyltransferase [Myxosarcina sp. GI1]|uniref:DNA cytosine methyltransferase n=1 Tax=Myxosarcina sp. GI1 TaxID=1541065 RepID=UPI0009078DEC|nr:DNA cytosine methyltransferase [Myxosarcina sp. GI1]
MLRHLDLFSGIGGFTLAAKQLGGIQTTQFVEIDSDAQTVLRSHFPGVPIHSDIRDYQPEPGAFDLITMGFPCTGTSNAGSRTGLKHPASSLWREGLRCLIEAQPRFCIIEQPEGVIRRGLRAILGGLSLAGYSTEIEYVSAAKLGAGHQRLRLFIISYPNEWADLYQNAPCWSDQMREMVQRQRLSSQWLTVRDLRDRVNNGLSVRLVRGLNEAILEECHYTEPSKSPGRIRARYLAGRTVTPGQAAIALRRVLYLNALSDKTTTQKAI